MSLPSMAMVPLSGIRKPAMRLRSVVLPQPEGPSSVINSPRRTSTDASDTAMVSPKRLLTSFTRTAMSVPLGRVMVTINGTTGRSAGMLNVENLSETEEGVGEGQQRRGDHDIDNRDCRHRRIGVLAHVIVHGDRQRLS